MDNREVKRDGFGIGELGMIPSSTPLDDYEAEQIMAAAQISWAAKQAAEIITCVKCGCGYTRRTYRVCIPGCAVLCQGCLEAYLQRTFHLSITEYEDVMLAKLQEFHGCEYASCRNRGYWDSDGAGYACENHMGLLA